MPKLFESNFVRGVLTIGGGLMIHLVLGSFYLWGAIDIYVFSYFREVYDINMNANITQIVSPVMLFALSCGLPFGTKIMHVLGKRLTCMGLGLSLSAAIFVSSFIDNFWGFVVVYGLGFGIFGGFLYMIPVYSAVLFFQDKKGIVTGIIIAAFGFGSLVTNFISLSVVNPDNLAASKLPTGEKYFPWDMAKELPVCLRYLALYYACLTFFGSIMIFDPVEEKVPEHDITNGNVTSHYAVGNNRNSDTDGEFPLMHTEEKDEGKPNAVTVTLTTQTDYPLMLGFKSVTFYIEFLMIFFTSGFGLLLANNFKNYGLLHINDDKFLTLAGSLGSAANAGSRVVWGFLLDRFAFKKIYFSLVVVQLIIVGTMDLIVSSKGAYLVWIFITLGCEGGHFAMFPALTMKIFGTKTGTILYGVIYFAFCLANALQFLIVFFFKESLEYKNIFWIYLGITSVGIVLAILFKPKP